MSFLDKIVNGFTEKPLVSLSVCATVGGIGLTAYLYRKRKRQAEERELPACAKEGHYVKDKVYLLSFPRYTVKQLPSLSPFSMKLESWLRLHKIEYELVDPPKMQKSRKNQMPYIYFNGEEIPDSQAIIEFLSRHHGIDLSYGLSKEEQGVSRAYLKMVEENTSWTYFMYRYVWHMDEYSQFIHFHPSPYVDKFAKRGLSKWVKERGYMHGIGRHSEKEVAEIARKDLKALSGYLGEKPFLMGDKPTLVDCTVFGNLAQVVYQDMNYPHKVILRDDCPNILSYCDRFKAFLWPDWDDIVSPGKFE